MPSGSWGTHLAWQGIPCPAYTRGEGGQGDEEYPMQIFEIERSIGQDESSQSWLD